MNKLNKADIFEIYNKHVKVNYTPEYLNRYNPLPMHLNDKKWKWEGKDVPRIPAVLEFRKYSEKYNFNFDKVLSFNGDSDPEYEFIKYKQMVNYNYEENPDKYDLHNIDLEHKDFDFFMTNQTLEHLYNPFLAVENIYKHLREGGLFYTNVPSNNIPHSTPEHYYTGFTPVGLGALVKSVGFEILEIGQWGNKEYLNYMYSRNGWGDISYSKEPCKNEVNCPLITWVLAKK